MYSVAFIWLAPGGGTTRPLPRKWGRGDPNGWFLANTYSRIHFMIVHSMLLTAFAFNMFVRNENNPFEYSTEMTSSKQQLQAHQEFVILASRKGFKNSK